MNHEWGYLVSFCHLLLLCSLGFPFIGLKSEDLNVELEARRRAFQSSIEIILRLTSSTPPIDKALPYGTLP